MIDKSIKRIGVICLCLASLSLTGCFHIPDEDRLPSRNKVNTGDTQNGDQVEQALNSLIDGIDKISSQHNQMKDNEVETNENIEESKEITNEEGINGEGTENVITE